MDLYNTRNKWVGMAQPQGRIGETHLWAYIYDNEPTTHYPHVQIMVKRGDNSYGEGDKDRRGRDRKTICTIRLRTDNTYNKRNFEYESEGSAWHRDLNHADLKATLEWLNSEHPDLGVAVGRRLWADYRDNNNPSINYYWLTHVFMELEGEEQKRWVGYIKRWCKGRDVDFEELYQEWGRKWEKSNRKKRRG